MFHKFVCHFYPAATVELPAIVKAQDPGEVFFLGLDLLIGIIGVVNLEEVGTGGNVPGPGLLADLSVGTGTDNHRKKYDKGGKS